jgi:hypothetical protein
MDDPKQIREVTGALIREFVEWTHDVSMFYSSPGGAAFGEELRAVFAIALKATDPLALAERAVVEAAIAWHQATVSTLRETEAALERAANELELLRLRVAQQKDRSDESG